MNSGNKNTLIDGSVYQEMLDQVGVAVFTIDTRGRIQHTNRSSSDMFGYDEGEMLGENVSMLMPEHYSVRHDGYLHHHITTGENRIIGKGRLVEGLRANGVVFPMHLSVGKFERQGEIYFLGIVHDLTVQEEAQDKALRFGRIIENSVNEIFVFKADTLRFTLVNSGALQNMGYSLSELLQMTPVDIKPDYSDERFRSFIAPLINGDVDKLNFNAVHQRKDGTRYDVDIVLHLSDAAISPECVAIIQDTTERNAMLAVMQQSQKMESIGQLTGGIAHDFNNLLTVITGNLELLEMSTANEANLELIEEARSAAALGADITSRLLSFARRSPLLPKRLDLNHVILDMSDLLKRSVGEGVSFHTELFPGIWPIKVDQSQLDSALLNLAINARDAMSGSGTLILRTGNEIISPSEAEVIGISAGDYVVFTMRDTGIGIGAEKLTQVFEPFYTTKSQSNGQGLGLSMVYGFARQSGGAISVSSERDKGACFKMRLPRDWSSEQTQGSIAEVVIHTPKNIVILVVEDDEKVRRLTVRRLAKLGHKVIESINGADAIEKFRDHPEIDLLFSDIVMPGPVNGWQLAHSVLQKQPGFPIILSSGYSEKLTMNDEAEMQSVTLLHKPYSLKELELTLSNALDK